MKTLMIMALRNIGRNRRRTLLAVASVGISLLFLVFLQGFLGGMTASMVKNYTKNETGHIRITTKEFAKRSKFFPVTENIREPGRIMERILQEQTISRDISLITERINFGVFLENEGHNKTAVALSGDPVKERDLLYLQKSILQGGRYIEKSGETIVGVKTAEALHLEVGDTLKVMTQGSDYALHLKKFLITGIFRTGVNSLDDGVFQIPVSDAKELLRTEGGTQQILIMLTDYKKAGAVAETIRRLAHDESLAIIPWTDIGDYPKLIALTEKLYGFILVVVVFLGTFIITNIMMMVVLERKKEIGILKALGFSRRKILFLFLAEGAVLGLIGSAIGVASGFAVNVILHFKGIDFSGLLASFNYPMDNVLYPVIDPAGVIGLIVLGTLVSTLVSLLPSRRAATMNAVDAIKSV